MCCAPSVVSTHNGGQIRVAQWQDTFLEQNCTSPLLGTSMYTDVVNHEYHAYSVP